MLEYPPELAYSPRHTWARVDEEEGTAEVGVTEHLSERLDELHGIDMPRVGDELEMDEMCIHLHLDTNILHLRAPLSGRVIEINRDVLDNPNLLHVAPYKHWIMRMECDELEELDMMMSAAQYMRHVDA